MGIHIQTLRDHLCNHVFGLSSREKPELGSIKIGFNPSEGPRTPEQSQFGLQFPI